MVYDGGLRFIFFQVYGLWSMVYGGGLRDQGLGFRVCSRFKSNKAPAPAAGDAPWSKV
jgi:hypothetical protein